MSYHSVDSQVTLGQYRRIPFAAGRDHGGMP
ncbi:hypothetical protein FraQA3DRAFT_4885 [Frankia sp. QA3]|nr:hypothetical protein FraQA3DRAFT_4885 [Frankia sp. QA3]